MTTTTTECECGVHWCSTCNPEANAAELQTITDELVERIRDDEREARLDAISDAIDHLEAATTLLRDAGVLDEPAFRAYHAATFEGREGGWLGGPFLIDALRDLLLDESDDDESEVQA